MFWILMEQNLTLSLPFLCKRVLINHLYRLPVNVIVLFWIANVCLLEFVYLSSHLSLEWDALMLQQEWVEITPATLFKE